MDLENQQRVKDAAEKYGAENVVVILGSHLRRALGWSPVGTLRVSCA